MPTKCNKNNALLSILAFGLIAVVWSPTVRRGEGSTDGPELIMIKGEGGGVLKIITLDHKVGRGGGGPKWIVRYLNSL